MSRDSCVQNGSIGRGFRDSPTASAQLLGGEWGLASTSSALLRVLDGSLPSSSRRNASKASSRVNHPRGDVEVRRHSPSAGTPRSRASSSFSARRGVQTNVTPDAVKNSTRLQSNGRGHRVLAASSPRSLPSSANRRSRSASQLSSPSGPHPRSPLKSRSQSKPWGSGVSPRSGNASRADANCSTASACRPLSAPSSARASGKGAKPTGRGSGGQTPSRMSTPGRGRGRGRVGTPTTRRPPWVDPFGKLSEPPAIEDNSSNASFGRPIFHMYNKTCAHQRTSRVGSSSPRRSLGGDSSIRSSPQQPCHSTSVCGSGDGGQSTFLSAPKYSVSSNADRVTPCCRTSRGTTSGTPVFESEARAKRYSSVPSTQEVTLRKVPPAVLDRLRHLPHTAPESGVLGMSRLDLHREEDLMELFRQQYTVDPLLRKRPGRRQFLIPDHLTYNGVRIHGEDEDDETATDSPPPTEGEAVPTEQRPPPPSSEAAPSALSSRGLPLRKASGVKTASRAGSSVKSTASSRRSSTRPTAAAAAAVAGEETHSRHSPRDHLVEADAVGVTSRVPHSSCSSVLADVPPAFPPAVDAGGATDAPSSSSHSSGGQRSSAAPGATFSPADEAGASAVVNRCRAEHRSINLFQWNGPSGVVSDPPRDSVGRRSAAAATPTRTVVSRASSCGAFDKGPTVVDNSACLPAEPLRMDDHYTPSSQRQRRPSSGRTSVMNALNASKDHDIFGVTNRIRRMVNGLAAGSSSSHSATRRRRVSSTPEAVEPFASDTSFSREPFGTPPVLSTDLVNTTASTPTRAAARPASWGSRYEPAAVAAQVIVDPPPRPFSKSPGKCRPKEHDIFNRGRGGQRRMSSEVMAQRGRGAVTPRRGCATSTARRGRSRSTGRDLNVTSEEVLAALHWAT